MMSRRLLLGMFAAILLLIAVPVAVMAEQIPGWKILNLDIDRSVSSQKRLSALIDDSQDLHDCERLMRLWTHAKGLKTLRQTIAQMRGKYPNDKWLTFEGSGDFHHVAATLIESLPESARPVTVILFDNHPDWFKAPIKFHCASWVVQVLRHPWVDRVIMIGQDNPDIRGDQFLFAPFKELRDGRVQMYPYRRTSNLVPLKWATHVKGVESSRRTLAGSQLTFTTVTKLGVQGLATRLANELAGKNVYITIDKDVLSKNDAITDWDQGELTLPDLLSTVSKICLSSNVVGVDVCGERAPDPIQGFFKEVDCGRLFKRHIDNWEQTNSVNEQTNLSIVKTIAQSAGAGRKVVAK